MLVRESHEPPTLCGQGAELLCIAAGDTYLSLCTSHSATGVRHSGYDICVYLLSDAFTKLRKATVSCVISIRVEQLGSHLKDFRVVFTIRPADTIKFGEIRTTMTGTLLHETWHIYDHFMYKRYDECLRM
jgi:hypothetical protein